MPLYEYGCSDCGERLEVLQKVSDAPLAMCPRCGGHMEKLLSAPALQFKGSGWYITDYAGAGRKSAVAADGSDGEKKAADKPPASPASKPAESAAPAAGK